MPARLDHLTVTADHLDTSASFYDAVLGSAGWGRVVAYQDFEDEDEVGEEAIGYGVDETVTLWLVAGRRPTSGAHVALRVDGRQAVDAVAAATGVSPRRRGQGRPTSYGVEIADPAGNVVEIFTVVH